MLKNYTNICIILRQRSQSVEYYIEKFCQLIKHRILLQSEKQLVVQYFSDLMPSIQDILNFFIYI